MGETGDCFPGSIRLTNTPSHQRCLSVCMYASVCVFVCVRISCVRECICAIVRLPSNQMLAYSG